MAEMKKSRMNFKHKNIKKKMVRVPVDVVKTIIEKTSMFA